MAGVAGVLGFAIVLLTPRFFTVQRTAALPGFQDAANRAQPAANGHVPAPVPEAAAVQPAQSVAPQPAPAPAAQVAAQPAPAPVSRYAGKSARGGRAGRRFRLRASLQAVRAAAQPPASEAANAHKVTAADEKLHCLLTEVTGAVLCAQSEAQGDRRHHQLLQGHRIHQHGDQRGREIKVQCAPLNGRRARRKATIDPRVVEADRGALMRAGYLTKATSRRDRRERAARDQGSLRAHDRQHADLPEAALVGGLAVINPCWRMIFSENRFTPPIKSGAGFFGIMRYDARPSAASISLTASSLAHSAGPASAPSSQPFGSISSVVGMPNALPIAFRSWNTLALESA